MKNEKFDLPDLKEIPNGEKVTGTFSENEMKTRLDSLRTVMSDIGMDSVLFTSIHNINYYSDFLYCSFGRPYGLVITADKATTISANIDAGQPYRRTYGENLVYTDWRRDNYTKAVIELIGDSKKIGIEFDHVNLSLFEKLQDSLTNSEMIYISVNTPTKTSGEGKGFAADLKYIELCAKQIAKVSKTSKIIVEKSTVPVRTSEKIKEILKSKNQSVDFQILSNPEFLAEGTAMRDLQIPDRVIFGGDDTKKGNEAIQSLVDIYSSWIPKKNILTT